MNLWRTISYLNCLKEQVLSYYYLLFVKGSHHTMISYGCSRTDKPVAPPLILHLARLSNERHVGNVIIHSVILLCLKFPITGFHLLTWTSLCHLKKVIFLKVLDLALVLHTVLILTWCFSFSFDLLNHHLARQLNQPTISHCWFFLIIL